MVATKDSLSESHLATPEAVGVIRRSVAEYAGRHGVAGVKLDAVRLAVSEAVTNVVMHAYREEPGQVHVTAQVVQNELWVLISDDGCGSNTPPERPGLGVGLALITDACSEFTLAQRAEGGTEARMCFALGAQPSTGV